MDKLLGKPGFRRFRRLHRRRNPLQGRSLPQPHRQVHSPDAGERFQGPDPLRPFPPGLRPGGPSKEPWRLVSPFYVPTLDPWEAWECRVGLGYTRFVTRFYGLDFDIRIFVPMSEDLSRPEAREIRDIRVRNSTDRKIELDLVPVVEYTHFDALKQLTNADWVPQTMQSRALRDAEGRIVLAQCAYMKRGVGRELPRLERSGLELRDRPQALPRSQRVRHLGPSPVPRRAGAGLHYEARRGDNIGALMHHMGELESGASVRLVTQLGQAASVEAALGDIERMARLRPRSTGPSLARLLVGATTSRPSRSRAPCPPSTRWSTCTTRGSASSRRTGRATSRSTSWASAPTAASASATPPRTRWASWPTCPPRRRARSRSSSRSSGADGSAMHQFNPLTMVGERGRRPRAGRPAPLLFRRPPVDRPRRLLLPQGDGRSGLPPRRTCPSTDKDERGRTGDGEGVRSSSTSRARWPSRAATSGRHGLPAPRLRRLERHGQPADRRGERLHRLPLRRGPARASPPSPTRWATPSRRRAGGPGTPR